MSHVIVAANAGFCPGVRAATERLARRVQSAEAGERIYTLGHLIHNEDYNAELERAGVRAVAAEELAEIAAATDAGHTATVFIRAHGIPKETKLLLEQLAAEHPRFRFEDCTCPFVQKIHRIAKEACTGDGGQKNIFIQIKAR